jgi:hypothetical protein
MLETGVPLNRRCLSPAAAVPDLVLNLLCTIDERGYLKLGLQCGIGLTVTQKK